MLTDLRSWFHDLRLQAGLLLSYAAWCCCEGLWLDACRLLGLATLDDVHASPGDTCIGLRWRSLIWRTCQLLNIEHRLPDSGWSGFKKIRQRGAELRLEERHCRRIAAQIEAFRSLVREQTGVWMSDEQLMRFLTFMRSQIERQSGEFDVGADMGSN